MSYYLDENLITKTEKTIKVQLILGGFMVFGSLGVILDSVFNLGITEEKVALKLLPIYVVILLAFAYVLFRGIQNSMLVSAARTYSKIFLEDKDGIVTQEELCNGRHKESYAVKKELETLFKRLFLIKCSLSSDGNRFSVVLQNANVTENRGFDFIVVKCESCGASSRVRQGSSGRCDYCGSAINGF